MVSSAKGALHRPIDPYTSITQIVKRVGILELGGFYIK